MKHSHVVFSILVLTGCFSVAFAQTNNWNCATYDSDNKMWSAQSDYKKSAMNKSIAACKKESLQPTSCTPTKSLCEALRAGVKLSQNPNKTWRCSALDMQAENWQGNDAPLRDEAAFGAKAYCRSKSAVPDTCYVNWFSCLAPRVPA